jgi:hypothetical protein
MEDKWLLVDFGLDLWLSSLCKRTRCSRLYEQREQFIGPACGSTGETRERRDETKKMPVSNPGKSLEMTVTIDFTYAAKAASVHIRADLHYFNLQLL